MSHNKLRVLKCQIDSIEKANRKRSLIKVTPLFSADNLFKEIEMLDSALPNLTPEERADFALANHSIIKSSDGKEVIKIVWCPNCQILSNLALHKDAGRGHPGSYTGVWQRRINPRNRSLLLAEVSGLLERRQITRTKHITGVQPFPG